MSFSGKIKDTFRLIIEKDIFYLFFVPNITFDKSIVLGESKIFYIIKIRRIGNLINIDYRIFFFSKSSIRLLPINPSPPVTIIFFDIIKFLNLN